MFLFSVIIPCYNSALWIRQALDSVFAQRGDDFEVIAVDDGSTDDTLAILKAYGDGVQVLSQHNQGAGVSRNLAVSKATGEYIATLDADDLWFPWTLATYRELISRFENPSIIAGRPCSFNEEHELVGMKISESIDCRIYLNFYQAARDGFWFLLNGALVIRKDVFKTCGGFAEQRINSEDTHLFMKFGMSPGFVAVKSPPLFGYRMHGENAMLNSNLNQAGCRFLIAQEKNAAYPGGKAMKRIRRAIFTTHARSASVACLKAGNIGQGWKLYTQTLKWNFALGRLKYLVGFPLFMAKAVVLKVRKPR